MKYDFKAVEAKWQKIWEEKNVFAASNDYTRPKYYALVEFPYPSGQGLHVGHPRSYTALDIVARKRRLGPWRAEADPLQFRNACHICLLHRPKTDGFHRLHADHFFPL